MCYAGAVADYLDGFKKYGKKIWITEMANWNPNINSYQKQAQQMQAQMAKVQEELAKGEKAKADSFGDEGEAEEGEEGAEGALRRLPRDGFEFHGPDQAIELTPMQQQFARPCRVRGNVGGGRRQWRNVTTEQPGLAGPDQDIALFELGTTIAQALDLPALQRQASFDALLDKEVMPCLLVESNRRSRR